MTQYKEWAWGILISWAAAFGETVISIEIARVLEVHKQIQRQIC